jgi:hypothetical protein
MSTDDSACRQYSPSLQKSKRSIFQSPLKSTTGQIDTCHKSDAPLPPARTESSKSVAPSADMPAAASAAVLFMSEPRFHGAPHA